MQTLDECRTKAPVDLCYRLAADVERWPELLPHYRWVRFRRRDSWARGEVEMAAWRRFGPLGFPTWWISEMTHDPEARTIQYEHVAGITRGMRVLWQVLGESNGTCLRITHVWPGPRWPLFGPWAADHVIGPHFISFIAARTLESIARAAEGGAS